MARHQGRFCKGTPIFPSAAQRFPTGQRPDLDPILQTKAGNAFKMFGVPSDQSQVVL